MYSAKKRFKTTSGNSNRPKTSRRRPLNLHELEAPDDLNASTSKKKLKKLEDLYDVEVEPAFGYRMINFTVVFSVISNVVLCKLCKSKVKFTESGRRDFGLKIVMSCENYEKTEILPSSYDMCMEVDVQRIKLAERSLSEAVRVEYRLKMK